MFHPAPATLDARRASYRLRLTPQSHESIELWVGFERNAAGSGRPEAPCFDRACDRSVQALERRRGGSARVDSSDPRFAEWIERSASDLQMMIRGLQVGAGRVDLVIESHRHDVGVYLLARDGDVGVVVTK